MSLTISLASESDIPVFTALTPLAFAKDLPWSTIFPKGATPAYLAHYTALDTEEFRTSTTLNCLKVVDHSPSTTTTTASKDTDNAANTFKDSTSDGTIIAWAGWHILPAQHTSPNPSDPPPPQQTNFPPDARADLGARFFGAGLAKRHSIMGTDRPYVFLAVLASHPDHQGRGAGGLCMKWGVKVADQLGVDCYVESTAAGAGLYRKWGFEERGRLEIDLRDWRDQVVEHLCMVRPARAKTNPDGDTKDVEKGKSEAP